MALIRYDNVSKQYGKRTAVKDVSLEIKEGEIFGLIGPNGAGKTTLIKMTAGLVKISEGDIYIDEYSVKFELEQAIASIGGIIENPEMYKSMSGLDNLRYFAMLYGNIPPARIDYVVKLVNLEHRIKDKVKAYSLGMRQRLGIAQALLHSPKLLLLDEPTNGLDPAGIREMREIFINLARNEKVSIIISSHILKEMEMLVDRFAVINNGEIISINNPKHVDFLKTRVLLSTSNNEDALALLQCEFDYPCYIDGDCINISTEPSNIKNITKTLVLKDFDINYIKQSDTSLEEFYVNLLGNESHIL